MQDAGCGMQDAGCRMQDAGCRMQDAGCRMQDAGLRIADCGLRIAEWGWWSGGVVEWWDAVAGRGRGRGRGRGGNGRLRPSITSQVWSDRVLADRPSRQVLADTSRRPGRW